MTLVYGSVYLSPKRDRGETMSHLQFAKGISRLGTESAFVVLSRAQKLAAEGHDIINLGIGQPDFRTPEHIVQAAISSPVLCYSQYSIFYSVSSVLCPLSSVLQLPCFILRSNNNIGRIGGSEPMDLNQRSRHSLSITRPLLTVSIPPQL